MDKSSEGVGGGGESRDGGPSSSTPSTSSGPAIGCGSAGTSGNSTTTSTAVATVVSPMTLNVTTTTGGSFSVVVDGENSVENLKKIISKKLKVSKDRICLLHRERELHDGSLRDNGLMDGSKLILTPNVETGLLAQRAENTVMQALESLNDNQVNDFLSGKSPLNLSVRLGDHMMLIQLQLSTLNPTSAGSGSRSKTHKGSRTITAAAPSSGSSVPGSSGVATGSSRRTSGIPIGFRRVTTGESRSLVERVGESQTLTRQDIENIHSIVKNLAESDNPTVAAVASGTPVEQSPIRSLSNLVSSSINNNPDVVTCTDPISANLTSCLCKRLDNNDNNSCESNCAGSRVPEPAPQPSTSSAPAPPQQHLHRTAQNPIARHKTKVQTLRKHISFDSSTVARTEPETVLPVPSPSFSAPNSPQHQQPGPSRIVDPNSVENPALAEASRNLTQTLRKLSKRVFTSTSKVTESAATASPAQEATSRNSAVNSGAVIESMKHHGKGIYSGTFSGTLNPALQDKFGRPKRDISTIIHILNDLLSAAPQCARSGTKIYFEPSGSGSSSTAAPQGAAAAAGSSTSSTAATTFTTPVAAPSPRLVSRCMPTPIPTKKFPGNPGTITSNASATCHRVTAAAAAAAAAAPPVVKIQCKCGHPLLTPTGPATQCQRCAAELENSKTKSKLDSLRLIMQQKKERREARKQRTAPYTVPPAAAVAIPNLPSPVPAPTRHQPTPVPIPSGSAAAVAAPAIVGESQPSSPTNTSTDNSNSAAGSATTTATATAAATTTAAEAAAAAQSHQLVEEVDTVA